jgi:2-iminobutanoate/2-iminopropanoate deaminase
MLSSKKVVIATPVAPAAIGPYSQAIKSGDFIYCSGQIPLDPKSGEIVGADVKAQTERVIRNLEAVLDSVGSGLFHVVKTTVYLKNIDDFAAMNEAYGRFFSFEPPARATVEVSRLPKDVMVEIDCIAYVPPQESATAKPF